MSARYIYQTHPFTGDRLAFGPFTPAEVQRVRSHCGGLRVHVSTDEKPRFPCHDNGDTLRRAAGLRPHRTA